MIFIDDKDEKKFFNIQRVLYIYLVHLLYNKTNIIHESNKDTGNYYSTWILVQSFQQSLHVSSQQREKKKTK